MSLRFAKPVKATPEERRQARRKKARALRKAKPPGVAWLEHLADELHSILIRASREGCELAPYPAYRSKDCQGPDVHPSRLQLAHGFTRRDKSVRFDPSNTFAACPQCHRKHSPSGAAWYGWMRERLGDSVFENVFAQARVYAKRLPDDLALIVRQRVEEIGDLPHSIRREWAEERLAALATRLRRCGLTPSTEEEHS